MRPSKLFVVPILALTACGGEPTGDVATVANQSLTQEQLLGYMARMEPSRAGPYALADALAQGWLDLALVAEAAGRGLTPTDTALQREVLAPQVLTEHLRRLQNAVAVARDPLTEEDLRRTFQGDSLRLFQRVLVRVPSWQNPLTVEGRRARVDSILALAQGGAPFDRLAIELSEGPTAPIGGYIGVVTRGDVPTLFRDSLWVMGPGGVSPVLRIDEGFQIVRRPPFDEARAQLAAHLLGVAGARADSLLADSLATAHRLALLPATATRLRNLLTNPDSMAPDSLVVVGFDEGGVSPEEAWHWLAALPDAARLSLARASDVDLEATARAIGRNALLYRLARARGIDVGPEDLSDSRTEFVTATDSLLAAFADADGPTRSEMVDSIVGSVLEGHPTRLLPAGLAPALRRRIPHAVDRDALAAVAREASYQVKADSVATGG